MEISAKACGGDYTGWGEGWAPCSLLSALLFTTRQIGQVQREFRSWKPINPPPPN
ncbi:MAG: hypothetical protein MJE68_22080 [Proteobacteria bacterium]|nr:hypothetical protein [Pseudomonadota bacterium]